MKGAKVMFSSATDEWATPDEVFKKLDRMYDFELDASATFANSKCLKFYSKEESGLDNPWFPHRTFCNPPFSLIGKFVAKAREEADKGGLVVMLLPARVDTRWFHDHIYKKAKQIEFIKGRLKFGGSTNSAPFPSMLIVM